MSQKTKWNLSYTAYSTYMQCPKKFDYHYNEKIRPVNEPAHLIFGSAMDKAFNACLLENADPESELKSELQRLISSPIAVEDKDYDGDLVSGESEHKLIQELRQFGWKGDNCDALADSLFQRITLGEDIGNNGKAALSRLIYYSYLEMGRLMISAFNDYFKPQIEEIVSVQKKVKRGIADFEVKLSGIEGVVLGDNKTSGRDYAHDAVQMSVQLAGYGAKIGAYIVFSKNIRKNRTKICSVCGNNGTGKRHKSCDAVIDGDRCGGEWNETISPEVIPQILIGEIPEHNREMVERAYSDTEKLVETGVFPRNLNSCQWQYGKPCPYIDLCWKNSMAGLIGPISKEKKE